MSMDENTNETVTLLPENKSFYDLLWPYLTPYLVFVAISSIPETLLPAEFGQILKLVTTAAALFYFRRTYRFGPLTSRHALISLLALPMALACWIGPFYLLTASGIADVVSSGTGDPFSPLVFYLGVVNSVILVAVFEEMFIRVYILGWLHQAGENRQDKGMLNALLDTLDELPKPLRRLPLSTFSIVGATIVFAGGHHAYEYLSAVAYFLFTTWLYKKSGSLWVCIIIHGLTNLGIALLARYAGMGWLW
ncbi:MAG: hypothetical protein CSA23_00640 [Deltaproteobacteria bacterium]|nr:MAG: hypothetical protein CSA23_00640 [Deltaproteobacteria bacterium]